MTPGDIRSLITTDVWMMRVLRLVQTLHLPDWWIGAGFVRNKVWDELHGFSERTPLSDIDVIYFDSQHTDELSEKELEKKLTLSLPGTPWSCTNQARMRSDVTGALFSTLTEALSEWPETATSLAVTLDDSDRPYLLAPHGIDDLVNLRVRPTPSFMKQRVKYEQRQAKKAWAMKWPNLTFFTFPN